MCKVLGFTRSEGKDLKWNVERTAFHCSYAIVVHRYQLEWGKKPLLDVPRWN